MLDFVFALIAAGMNTGETEAPAVSAEAAASTAVVAAPQSDSIVSIGQGSVTIGQGVLVEGKPEPGTPAPAAAPTPTPDTAPAPFNMAVVPSGLTAEPQAPSGKFTTAAEVRPILEATKANWVAVREYDGQDLLYVTHLWGWRCGLAAMAISVNDEPMQNWPLPPCHMQYTTPNAILEGDGFPYLTLRQGAVETITIQIVYDDLSMDIAAFARGNVLIP
jgi:hypothetical protein